MGKENRALYHSRTMIGWGAGHDLTLNLIDLNKCESVLYSYQIPVNAG